AGAAAKNGAPGGAKKSSGARDAELEGLALAANADLFRVEVLVERGAVAGDHGFGRLEAGERRDVEVRAAGAVEIPERLDRVEQAEAQSGHPVVTVLRGIRAGELQDEILHDRAFFQQAGLRTELDRVGDELFRIRLEQRVLAEAVVLAAE